MNHFSLIEDFQNAKRELIIYVNSMEWDTTLRCKLETLIILIDQVVDELNKK